MSRQIGWARCEDGSVSVFIAVLALALFALAGLVTDGGRALAARAADASEAFAAARAGAEALSTKGLADQGAPELDPAAAQAAAQGALSTANATGRVRVSGNTVHVQVSSTTSTILLGLVGIRSLSVSGSASASAQEGL